MTDNEIEVYTYRMRELREATEAIDQFDFHEQTTHNSRWRNAVERLRDARQAMAELHPVR